MKNKKEKYCELHVHLEGCIWESHISKNWHNSEFLFPPISIYKRFNNNFDRFLAQIRFGYNFLCGTEQYCSVFNDYISYMYHEDIVYSEVQINLALLNTFNIDIKLLLKEFNKILQTNEKVVKFIIDLPWQFSTHLFEFIINAYDELKELGVVGISMGGNESYAKPHEVAEIFNKARQVGLKLLCHAGETTSFKFSKKIIEELKPDRIAHGISIASWLVNDGRSFAKLDTCLTSNLSLEVVKNIENHPINLWLDANIPFTLSTDDPAIFDTTLSSEFILAEKAIKKFSKYIKKYKSNVLECCFDQESVDRLL